MTTRLGEWLRRPGAAARQTVSPDKAYRMWAATYGNPPNAFQALEDKALRELLPPLLGCRVLDLGCGTGRLATLARQLGARHAVGVDRSAAMLAEARQSAVERVQWTTADAPALPFADGAFDVVMSGLMMGHVADFAGAMAEAARVLRSGGVLLISDFHPFATLRGWQRTVVDPDSGREFAIEQHLHLFSEYLDHCARHGLVVDGLREPRFDGFPVAFVLRARSRAVAR